MARKITPAAEITVGSDVNMEDLDVLLADLEVEVGGDDGFGEQPDIVEEEVEEVELPGAEASSLLADSAAEADEIRAALSAIDGLDVSGGAVTEASDDDVTAALSTIALDEVKKAAYAAAEGEPEAAAPAAARKAKTPKPPAAPRVSKTADELKPENFVLEAADATADLDALKAAVLASCPKQKKIVEKFHNILCAIAAGKLPSVYAVIAYKVIRGKGGATSNEIVAAMQTEGYSIGTARSQTGQLMALFDTLKIAKRAGNTLTPNPDSMLAVALDALLADEATPA